MLPFRYALFVDDLWIHVEKNHFKVWQPARFFEDIRYEDGLPRPFGVFFLMWSA